MRTVADLVPLVRRHAGPEGRSASALPGLWFHRYDRPRPLVRALSTTMSVGVAVLCSETASVLRQAAAPDGDRARVEAAMRFIEENAARPLSVAALARHVAMSASHFAHRFRDVASVTPMRFVRHVRLERARQLLLADGLTAQQAADRVGYASAAHFTRDFKRQFGLAPRAYTRAFAAGSGKIVAAAPTTAASRAAL